MVYVFPMCTAAVAGPSAGEDEEALPTYKEAFPPLPEKAAQPEGTQETSSAWASKIRPLKSSIITQVQLLLWNSNAVIELFFFFFFKESATGS